MRISCCQASLARSATAEIVVISPKSLSGQLLGQGLVFPGQATYCGLIFRCRRRGVGGSDWLRATEVGARQGRNPAKRVVVFRQRPRCRDTARGEVNASDSAVDPNDQRARRADHTETWSRAYACRSITGDSSLRRRLPCVVTMPRVRVDDSMSRRRHFADIQRGPWPRQLTGIVPVASLRGGQRRRGRRGSQPKHA
jgi:hypothetical protein